MNTLYNHNRYTQATTTSSFTPTQNNWLISANKGSQNIYFQNVVSYNNWAGTCCVQSAADIRNGSFGGYSVNFNKF